MVEIRDRDQGTRTGCQPARARCNGAGPGIESPREVTLADEREKPSWRERDRQKDGSAHRGEAPAPRGAPARVATATAQYKRQLDALFERGEVPAHLKDKLPAAEAGTPEPSDSPSKERVRLTRAVRQAPSGPELIRALDALRENLGAVPEALELVLRYLEHPRDAILAEALGHVEKAVDLGIPLPKTVRKTFLERLKGVALTSFDPRVQARAETLVSRLR